MEDMLFKLSIQYNKWLAKQKPGNKFSWEHSAMQVDAPVYTEEKLFKDMDEEEREAAFRREVFRVIHENLLR